jgi:hypothetical protein
VLLVSREPLNGAELAAELETLRTRRAA